jgi:hypothetical protein
MEPHIESAATTEEGRLRIGVVNPSNNTLTRRIGAVIFFPSDRGMGHTTVDLGERNWLPGDNEAVLNTPDVSRLPAPPSALLVFLNNPDWSRVHRYEGENFPRRVGIDMGLPGASQGRVRAFRRGKDRAGFLAFGPFIPHAPGFLMVDFHSRFDRVRQGIRPVCSLDIFSFRERKSLARRELKPREIEAGRMSGHRLWVAFSDTKTLEYRLYAEGWSDIMLDYIEVTYLQGKIVHFQEEKSACLSGLGTPWRGGGSGER